MPATTQTLELQTREEEGFHDLTDRVRQVVRQSGVASGAVVVHCPHTTAAITVQENTDPELRKDLLEAFDRLAPRDAAWRHAEGNAHAHVKAALLGSSCTVPVEKGDLVLGRWQAIYFVEFDGPRRRTVRVKVLAG